MLLFLAVSRVFFIINDFYVYPVVYNFDDTIFKFIGGMIQAAGLTLMVFVFEKMFVKKSHFFLTGISIAILIINFLNLILMLPPNILSFINYSVALIIVLIFPYFFFVLIRRTHGEIKKYMSLLLIGLVLYVLGITGGTKIAMDIIGLQVRLIADILKIFGLTTIIIGFYNLPTFGEFDWKEKLREMYIISSDGILIYHYTFSSSNISTDHDLIAGGVYGIKEMLSEMTASKQKLHIIDHEDVKIFFEYGEFVISALICEEERRTVSFKLREFTREFESFFKTALKSWNGNLDLFQPSKALIEKHFS